MNCQTVERYVDALLDREVDASTQLTIEQHVTGCAVCGERIAFARWLKEQLLREGKVEAPSSLRARVTDALEAESGPHLSSFSFSFSRPDVSWRATAAMAAVALLVFGIGGALQLKGPTSMASVAPLFEDVVRAHTRSYPAEVARGEQVPAYFADKVGFAVRPVKFSDPGVRFVGARQVEVGGRQAVTLQYETRGRRMTVVAFRPPAHAREVGEQIDTDGRLLRYVQVGNHLIPLVEHGGLVYAVVGDLESEDRLRLAAHALLPEATQ